MEHGGCNDNFADDEIFEVFGQMQKLIELVSADLKAAKLLSVEELLLERFPLLKECPRVHNRSK